MAVLAIAGIPLLSGFFSKDAILYAAFASRQPRQSPLVRRTRHRRAHRVLHVPPLVSHLLRRNRAATTPTRMRAPGPCSAPLSSSPCSPSAAAGSASGPLRRIPRSSPSAPSPKKLAGSLEYVLMALAVAAGALGWFIAHRMYYRTKPAHRATCSSRPAAYNLLVNKYYVDEIYGFCHRQAPHRASRNTFSNGSSTSPSSAASPGSSAGIATLRRRNSATLAIRESALLRRLARSRRRCSVYFVLAPYVFGRLTESTSEWRVTRDEHQWTTRFSR